MGDGRAWLSTLSQIGKFAQSKTLNVFITRKWKKCQPTSLNSFKWPKDFGGIRPDGQWAYACSYIGRIHFQIVQVPRRSCRRLIQDKGTVFVPCLNGGLEPSFPLT